MILRLFQLPLLLYHFVVVVFVVVIVSDLFCCYTTYCTVHSIAVHCTFYTDYCVLRIYCVYTHLTATKSFVSSVGDEFQTHSNTR